MGDGLPQETQRWQAARRSRANERPRCRTGEGARSSAPSDVRVKPDRTNTGCRAFPLVVV